MAWYICPSKDAISKIIKGKHALSDVDITSFLQSLEGKVIVAGYGSLLSRSSRELHSALFAPTMPVSVKGWERGWLTRAYHEAQTYVGALPNASSMLNAQLIPIEINPALQTREQDYRFTQISSSQLELDESVSANTQLTAALDNIPIYICETLDIKPADAEHPVNFSYIATCMAGSHEGAADSGIDDFLSHTTYWQKQHIRMDIKEPQYPRMAALSQTTLEQYAKRLQQHW
jgi:hypothetical protein